MSTSLRARYIGDTNGVSFLDLGPYLLNIGDVIDFANHPDADPDAFLIRADFEQLADDDDVTATVLERGDAASTEAQPSDPPPPPVSERIAGAGTHAALHAIAVELGIDVPEDPKAPWGDAVRTDEKRAVLEQAVAEGSGGTQGADVIEEASAGN